MSYTDEIKQIDSRMDSFERAILEMKNEQKQGFEKLSKEIEGLKTGIHGNKEHDQIGYRQRISELEVKVHDHDEFKKKALQLISLVTGFVSVLANIAIYLLSKLI